MFGAQGRADASRGLVLLWTINMKSHITVLINASTKNIENDLRESMEKHRLDADNIESIGAYHWDYWYFPSDDPFNDIEISNRYRGETEDIKRHSSYVRNLPENYCTSGIIRRDGTWVDIQDFSWQMVDEPSIANKKAKEKWLSKLRQILKENVNEICVQVITHS